MNAEKTVHDLLRLMLAKRRVRPLHHRRIPARDQGRRQDHAGVEPEPHPRAHQRAGALDHERAAVEGLRGDQRIQLRHQPAGNRPFPRQRVRAAGPRRHRDADDQHQDSEDGKPQPAAGAARRRDDQARPGDLRRRHRLRQIDLARRHGRAPQRKRRRPHHHGRGPDRIRARAQEIHHHPARGRHRHRQLVLGAEEHPAPGARRHPDRRDPRPRNHGIRDRLCRNRPPLPVDAARQQRQPGARPHHQLLPGRKAAPSC
jgi:hypothetical protein